MTLELNPRCVSNPERPKYAQLADAIASLVSEGHLLHGEKLPAEGAIADMVGVSKRVVREAFNRLERDGLLRRRNGVPAQIAPREKVRVIGVDRYFQEDRLIEAGIEATSSAFSRDHHIGMDQYRIELEIKKEPATPKDRALLHLRGGAGVMVWRRYFLKYAGDDPVEIQRSAISTATAERCPWMIDQYTQPYPGGTQRELADGGLRVTSVQHRVKTRNPTVQEKGDLQISDVPVWEIERVFLSRGVPVESSRVICSGPRHELFFDTVIGQEPTG